MNDNTINFEQLEALHCPHKEEMSEVSLSWILLRDYMIGDDR